MCAGELALRQQRAFRQHARALDDVFQLPHVAVPRGVEQQALGLGRQPGQGLLHALGALGHEGGREIRDVLAVLAKRRQFHFHKLQRRSSPGRHGAPQVFRIGIDPHLLIFEA